MSDSPITSIRAAAAQATRRPDYLAWVFAQYADAEGKTAGELAATLGVTGSDLSRLALCLRPRPDHFAADIQAIATRWKTEPAALAQIVRHVEVLHGMTENEPPAMAEHGLLMAARARKKPAPKRQEEK